MSRGSGVITLTLGLVGIGMPGQGGPSLVATTTPVH